MCVGRDLNAPLHTDPGPQRSHVHAGLKNDKSAARWMLHQSPASGVDYLSEVLVVPRAAGRETDGSDRSVGSCSMSIGGLGVGGG